MFKEEHGCSRAMRRLRQLEDESLCDEKHEPLYVEIKCHLDATEVFIADLIAC